MASNIGIGKEAPKLVFVGDKWNNKNTYDKKENPDGYLFGQRANVLRKYIYNQLDGAQGNLIKLIMYLIDTAEGFRLAEKTVLEETGLSHPKYIQARAVLIEIGWLIKDETQPDSLGINYDFLWAQASLPKEEQINMKSSIDKARIKLGYKK